MKRTSLILLLFLIALTSLTHQSEYVGTYEAVVKTNIMYGDTMKDTASMSINIVLNKDSTYVITLDFQSKGYCSVDGITINDGNWIQHKNFILFTSNDPGGQIYGPLEYLQQSKSISKKKSKVLEEKYSDSTKYVQAFKIDKKGFLSFVYTYDCHESIWGDRRINKKND